MVLGRVRRAEKLSLNIKNERVPPLAREVARRTGTAQSIIAGEPEVERFVTARVSASDQLLLGGDFGHTDAAVAAW